MKKQELKEVVVKDIEEHLKQNPNYMEETYSKAIGRDIVQVTKPAYHTSSDTIMKNKAVIEYWNRDKKCTGRTSIYAHVVVTKYSSVYHAYWIVGDKIIRTWCSSWYRNENGELIEEHPRGVKKWKFKKRGKVWKNYC